MDQHRFTAITLTVTEGSATICFSRPDVHNAFDRRQREETVTALRLVAADPSVTALTLTGAGEADFTSGQDPAEPVAPEEAAAWMAEWGVLYEAVLALDIPVLAAINGFAAGAGLQVALLADVRIAADDARLTLNEIDKGIPVITGTELLAPLTSQSLIQDMALTARVLTGRDALFAGIVSRSVPREDFAAAVRELGQQLAAAAPEAVRLNKAWWRARRGEGLGLALAEGARAHPLAYAAWAERG
ncbi:enoyl-CoA hydratase/isomerase family protein [Leucobacter sp. M11]|uniref:enoyl-CoA hydratase/isomerase family protein n=1 Tax=Leucobacter sp. M11 TaxID=2993565 RepID=UPI002D7FEC10|nr:enoyl-CoA hydratase/isomerase family protein [Leucobacter sp. M11]MEB4616273.1 enoyl-CoA hydratase/isomerase family protein [Leucobacter sp. M11]